MLAQDNAQTAEKKSRFRRALGSLAKSLGLGLVFVGATCGAVALHLDLAPTRRIVGTQVNKLLGSLFEGAIIADEIEHLGFDGVDIRSAVAVDPRRAQVIRASGIHARADVLELARDALFGKGELVITLPFVRVDDAQVLVEQGPAGVPTIAETFIPKDTGAPPPTEGGRAVRVRLERIEIGHAWAHGAVAPPRSLDADINRLVGKLVATPKGVILDVNQTGLVDRSFLPATTAGTAHYHLRVSADKVGMWAGFSGQLGKVEVQARAEIFGDQLAAIAEIPHATPEAITQLVPELPIREPVSASVSIEGRIPTFSITGSISVDNKETEGGTVLVDGAFEAVSPVRFDLGFRADKLDPRVVLPLEKTSPLDAGGRLRVSLTNEPVVELEAGAAPITIADAALPASDIHLVYQRSELTGTVSLHEPGMPIQGAFSFAPKRGLAFTAESEIPSISRAPRIAGTVDGGAHVRASGTLKDGTLDAELHGLFSSLRAPGEVFVDHGSFEGRIKGSIEEPRSLVVDASASGTTMRAQGLGFERVDVHATGRALRPHLEATLEGGSADAVNASGDLDIEGRGVRRISIDMQKDGATITGQVAHIGASRGGVAVEGVSLSSKALGKVEGGLAIRGNDLVGKLRGESVDLGRLAKWMGVKTPIRGLADLDIALDKSREGRKGHVQIALEEGEIAWLRGVSGLFNASFGENDKVRADGLLRLVAKPDLGLPEAERCNGSVGQIEIHGGEGTLEGPLLSAKTWENLLGRVEIEAENWDLRCLARALPVATLVGELGGKLGARFELSRSPGERFVSLRGLNLRTQGLLVEGPHVFDPPPWEVRGIDLALGGSLDGKTGKSTISASLEDGARLFDTSISLGLDLEGLLSDDPKRRRSAILAMPLQGRFSMPRRSFGELSTLPAFLLDKLPPLGGEVELDGYFDGKLEEPFVAMRLNGFGITPAPALGSTQQSAFTLPVDIDVVATYDAERASIEAHAKKAGQTIASATGAVEIAARDLFAEKSDTKLPWDAGFHLTLNELPIGEIPYLADREIGGHLNGTISLAGLNTQPRFKLDLLAPDLKVGQDLFFEEGKLSLVIGPREGKASANESDARVHAELVAEDGGRLDASAFAGVRWPAGGMPSIDGKRPADLYTKVQRFRVAVLHPMVSDILSKIDGYLDGEARIGWTELAEGDRGKIAASLRVSDGVVHVPQIGQELHDASLTIVSGEDGELKIVNLRAEGTRGRITGSGKARLDGLLFKSGEAKLSIKPSEALPLTLEGVPFGNAYGEIELSAEKKDRTVETRMLVPNLHLELPDTGTRSVQSLDESPSFLISHPIGPVKEARSPDALRYVLSVDLRRLDIEGMGIDISVAGVDDAKPTVELSDKSRISGDIKVLRGRFDVMGKLFQIEPGGLVRLQPEDTGNPYLNVTARWDAPDGSRIYADYIGDLYPITTQKLKFRSNPPRTQQAIFALLLVGGTENSTVAGAALPEGSRPTASGAVLGTAGELAAQEFNELLAGIAPLRNFSTRLSTASDGTLQPTVVYTQGDTLSWSASYQGPASTTATGTQGNTTGGTANSRAARTQFSVDWRFLPNWSVRGTLGVGGDQTSSGVDLLWQYRY